MRQQLEARRNNCAAFDTKRWVGNMEQGLQLAWLRYEKGLTPDHITIVDTAAVYSESGGSLL